MKVLDKNTCCKVAGGSLGLIVSTGLVGAAMGAYGGYKFGEYMSESSNAWLEYNIIDSSMKVGGTVGFVSGVALMGGLTVGLSSVAVGSLFTLYVLNEAGAL